LPFATRKMSTAIIGFGPKRTCFKQEPNATLGLVFRRDTARL
jgi:hypothetical protein